MGLRIGLCCFYVSSLSSCMVLHLTYCMLYLWYLHLFVSVVYGIDATHVSVCLQPGFLQSELKISNYMSLHSMDFTPNHSPSTDCGCPLTIGPLTSACVFNCCCDLPDTCCPLSHQTACSLCYSLLIYLFLFPVLFSFIL